MNTLLTLLALVAVAFYIPEAQSMHHDNGHHEEHHDDDHHEDDHHDDDHHDDDHHGMKQHKQRPEHYVGAKPSSTTDALAIFKKNIAKIEVLLNNQEVGVLELEKIHKISYSLESAVEYLVEHQTEKQEPVLNELDEAVQILHHASEEHEEDKARKWFAILKKEYNRTAALY